MYGSESQFVILRSAKLGQIKLPAVLDHLRDWIIEKFEVNVVHILFEHVEKGPAEGTPRLTVILETDTDYNSWMADHLTIRENVKRRILSQFKKLALAEPEVYDTEGLFLMVDNFSRECLSRACNEFRETDAARVVEKFEVAGEPNPIWRIDGLFRTLAVFFHTDEGIKKYAENGICAKISKLCFEGVQQYDEFGYLSKESFRLRFDSKENLDKNYEGSLFLYWR